MKKPILIIALLLFSSLSLFSQTKKTPNLKKLDAYFAKMVQDWDVPGASIGIVKDGKVVFIGNYGLIETEKSVKPDENTLYAIASNSKAFTSAIIGMLVQEAKLNWNDKVKDHLPYFSLYDDPWISAQVTVRDILSHRVGLGTFSGDVIWYKSDLTSENMIKLAGKLPQAYDFRAGYGYSNLMYITAGELIKKITGKTWGENVKERILIPLDMNRTLTTAKDLKYIQNITTPHGRENEVNFPIEFEDWGEIAATGGIISSVNDMAKWMIFNLNHGIIGKDTILTKATRNMVWTPHNNFAVDHTVKNDLGRHFAAYGLGWNLGDFHGNFMVGHTGGFDGMITAVTMIPAENLGIVVLTNGHRSPIMAATYLAFDQFLGTGTKDWSADLLARSIANQKNDTRISDMKSQQVIGTKPSFPLANYAGTFHAEIYGDITVNYEGGELLLEFENAPRLSAKLKHWHYDVWEIVWDEKHAWFSFGTVKFQTDNDMKITGLEFQVPNDDIFFEEVNAEKVN